VAAGFALECCPRRGRPQTGRISTAIDDLEAERAARSWVAPSGSDITARREIGKLANIA
jgi:hypothetical protein